MRSASPTVASLRKSGRDSEAIRRKVLVALSIAVVVLGVAAFSLSFDALRDLAVASGIEERLAWIWPLVVDGFICVATVAAVLLRPRGWRIAWYPWVTLAIAASVSVAGNALHAASHADLSRVSLLVATLVSAVPPAALLCASHMLVVLLAPAAEPRRDTRGDGQTWRGVDVSDGVSGGGEDHGVVRDDLPDGLGGTDAVPRPHQRTSETRRVRPTLEDLSVWLQEEREAGHAVTGAMVAERYGVSPSTGRRWLQAVRDGESHFAEPTVSRRFVAADVRLAANANGAPPEAS
ncbi:DUF2637 domain-containing protein [Phytoactinopolyspora mesophila]|uniref:DUF2637 domain-containing protein n=1 Tax=Phytoactinopolyspora mesophila TaxID=2650750 RepID=UPI001391632F